jgi:tripartite-type tricarboxylate transporter receptor subunit TctC
MNPDYTPRSRRAFVKTASAAAAAMALPARAQSDFPRGPVKVIVGLPPGGAADIIARTIGTQMEKSLKQPVVIENKPGGQFVISVQALLNAPADGQTLLYIYNGYASVNATLHNKFHQIVVTHPAGKQRKASRCVFRAKFGAKLRVPPVVSCVRHKV